jgi:hypothetical protein
MSGIGRRLRTVAFLSGGLLWAAPALAHDAFGDLGPFYANLLHPLSDQLQGILIVGAAALLAAKGREAAQLGLPVFVASAALALLATTLGLALPYPLLAVALAAALVGAAATLPARLVPMGVVVLLMVLAGGFVGAAFGPPAPGAGTLRPLSGALLGVAVPSLLCWGALDLLAGRLTPVVPAVIGSWVAASGVIVAAFLW